MMLPGMQHYMSRVGMGMGPQMLPGIHNFMRLTRLPLVDQATSVPNQAPVGHNPMLNPVNYPNQMQSSSFQEQYANYMNFQSMQNASPQVHFSLTTIPHIYVEQGLNQEASSARIYGIQELVHSCIHEIDL